MHFPRERFLLYGLCSVIAAGVGVALVLYGYSDYDIVLTTAQVGLNIAALIYIHRSLDDKWLQKKRTFTIDVGLLTSDGTKFTAGNAMGILTNWQHKQNLSLRPYLSGKVIEVYFPYFDTTEGETIIEPGISFMGELHPIYHKDLSDKEAINLIKQLAGEFGTKLLQKRVFWSFCDITSVWENVKDNILGPRETS